ncbi:hypothetical protein [Acidithiobacillus sp.]|uniref:hypothetical protein n=1 Tax=Acidithiobacillus sp. TaxID=1872118 RepID=UPI0026241914|nr:hypothetical protein [Acidithiobacillus sp.]MDD5278663.1 hypothetical protein [Acidithiobacillus sp.]
MANEDTASNGQSSNVNPEKGNNKPPRKGARPARAPIRGAEYIEGQGGRKKVAIEEFEARILAGRKIDVTVLNPLTHSVGTMLMPADRALQRLTEDLAMTSSKQNRAKYREAIAEFEDAQSDFMQAIYKLVGNSGMEISPFLKRRIRRADGTEEIEGEDTSGGLQQKASTPVL